MIRNKLHIWLSTLELTP